MNSVSDRLLGTLGKRNFTGPPWHFFPIPDSTLGIATGTEGFRSQSGDSSYGGGPSLSAYLDQHLMLNA